MLAQKFVDLYARGCRVPLPVAERDVALTYVLRILGDQGLLDQLVLKGGTCIRKVFFGRTARFSEDLDFTSLTITEPEDLIVDIAESFDGKDYYGIAFSVASSDFYVREDRRACGARVRYAHEWNPSAQFALDVSFREFPILPTLKQPLIAESYFERLEVEPPLVITLQLEEVIAEKIRAMYQRRTVRDVYDLFELHRKPFDRDLVRTLAVLKCWSVKDSFDPERFLAELPAQSYMWGDIQRLIRRDQQPDPVEVIAGCSKGYDFLRHLTPEELALTKDRYRHRQDLFERIVADLSPEWQGRRWASYPEKG